MVAATSGLNDRLGVCLILAMFLPLKEKEEDLSEQDLKSGCDIPMIAVPCCEAAK